VVFGVLAVLVLLLLAGGLGTAAYNAGVSAGLSNAAQQALASGQPVPGAYAYAYGPFWHGWGWGFGFFGIFFWILGILLVIGLVRGAFGWGRGRGRGPGGPDGWGGRREAIEDWHREMHRRAGEGTGG
jgi:hypothetical protein